MCLKRKLEAILHPKHVVDVVVKKGARGRYRAEVFNQEGDLTFVSPVAGYDSWEKCRDEVQRYFVVGNLTLDKREDE